ncbi:hypothetical protein N7522_013526 [Penicillium canescens]|nr:hypothetical protein N7522_013526 [Penicillium canescens]
MENRPPEDTKGLHILYEPEGNDAEAEIDIVAVHGLGGDSFETWTHQQTKCLWLRDLLPESKKFKNARIMTFGYDASAFTGPLKSRHARIFTFAQTLLSDLDDVRTSDTESVRPIIFIGHSLGGIVIKTALIYAHNHQAQFEGILNSTKAIIFFATPHQGSDSAVWATYLGHLGSALGVHSTQATQDLRRWSSVLVELTVNFSGLAPGFMITTFFETCPTNGVIVATEASACMGLMNERVVALSADHRQICKFDKAENGNYTRVVRRLEATAEQISKGDIPILLPSAPIGEPQLLNKSRTVFHESAL